MDFDSHTSEIVAATAEVVNVVTSGWSSGRPYQPPVGFALVEAINVALPTESMIDVADDQLAEFVGYVTQMRKVFELVDGGDGDVDSACELANGLLRETGAIPVLASHDGAPWHLHFHSIDASWARMWAGPMSTGLAMVLGSAARDRLGVCSASGCDRVYVDSSRNGARQFCGTTCQNRVKAAAFRERRRG